MKINIFNIALNVSGVSFMFVMSGAVLVPV